MAHLLKRLELNGFKSFAQKITLDFPEGITAIVGPNGSGKSNIIDAIRWLLGEREAKNLRGAKAEDLVFAGTQKRSRLGQAQASLHFDNNSNFFPVDFSEISVLRQVNRDGTNQYFLNKQEVRLKDLTDFFAQARLGSRGLTVITQGNSDIFIQSSPVSRREMIEEILGLREYRLKKTEAERRLKNTSINLEKVKALIEEILPHLRSLKRQTGRWEKRDVLEKDLKELENIFFGSQLIGINKNFDEVDKELRERKSKSSELESNRHIAEKRLKEIEDNRPKEQGELRELKIGIQKLVDKKSQLQKDLGRLEAQVEMARGLNKESFSPSAKALLDLVKRVREELHTGLEEDIMTFKHVVMDLVEEIDTALEEMESTDQDDKSDNFKTELKKVSQSLHMVEKDISSFKEKEALLERGQEEFYKTFKAIVGDLEKARDELEKWESQTRNKDFERERLEMRKSELNHQISQAGRNPSEFGNIKLNQIIKENEADELERKIFKLRGDLASIGEIDETLVKEAKETEDRHSFLKQELEDLIKASVDLRKLIVELDDKIKNEFKSALHNINDEFNKFFHLMFGGGQAKLKFTVIRDRSFDSKDEIKRVEEKTISIENNNQELTEDGIDIDIKLPRKRINSLDMLSGGERSLVGIAALFALISVSPPPFLVLDEVDAALDERNARRFAELLKEFSKKTQFIMVTHNRATMEVANVLYGVTLDEDGVSKILSLKFEEAK
jgi:chromosome segregation protein